MTEDPNSLNSNSVNRCIDPKEAVGAVILVGLIAWSNHVGRIEAAQYITERPVLPSDSDPIPPDIVYIPIPNAVFTTTGVMNTVSAYTPDGRKLPTQHFPSGLHL